MDPQRELYAPMPTPIGIVARAGANVAGAAGTEAAATATDDYDALDADADARRDDAAAAPYRSPEVRDLSRDAAPTDPPPLNSEA